MTGASEDHHGDDWQENPEHPLRDARECHRGVLLVAIGRQTGHDRGRRSDRTPD